MTRKLIRGLVIGSVTAIVALVVTGESRGFFGCLQRSYNAAAAQYGSTVCTPAGQQLVCNYVPQTCYRVQYATVPVTTYKPQTSCDPCSGCPTTCMRPVTSYVQQAQYVPYTTYRLVYSLAQPACPTPAQTSYYAPPAAAPVAPSGCSSCATGRAATTYYAPTAGATNYAVPAAAYSYAAPAPSYGTMTPALSTPGYAAPVLSQPSGGATTYGYAPSTPSSSTPSYSGPTYTNPSNSYAQPAMTNPPATVISPVPSNGTMNNGGSSTSGTATIAPALPPIPQSSNYPQATIHSPTPAPALSSPSTTTTTTLGTSSSPMPTTTLRPVTPTVEAMQPIPDPLSNQPLPTSSTPIPAATPSPSAAPTPSGNAAPSGNPPPTGPMFHIPSLNAPSHNEPASGSSTNSSSKPSSSTSMPHLFDPQDKTAAAWPTERPWGYSVVGSVVASRPTTTPTPVMQTTHTTTVEPLAGLPTNNSVQPINPVQPITTSIESNAWRPATLGAPITAPASTDADGWRTSAR